ncbi:hypothetical protein ACQPYK_08645 [Streptosporangium sp. CA-135522]|uniref:hypothetical protein n=1 Tax=Streptosporangium sp. CA-135522 TaxID=3240072 RepID=UPI003D89DE9E
MSASPSERELAEVVADLEWAMAYWPDLLDARLPMATPRPWRQLRLSPEAHAERDFEARVDWALRSTRALAEAPAPTDVTIWQTALDILVDADDLAAKVAETVGLPVLPPPGPGELNAWPYLAYAAAHLPAELAEWAAPIARRMQEKIAQALCMVYDGHTLDLTCPWCSEASVWRVQTLPGGMIAIVCGGVCEPPAREVGTWWHGQPCWPMSDWERLAKHVRVVEERERMAS